MGFLANRSAGINQPYQPAAMLAARNFCNKLWNMARFIEDKIGTHYKERAPKPKSIADHWVLARLTAASTGIATLIEDYRFAEAYDLLYHTLWDDAADWYIESSKIHNSHDMLAYVLETMLLLAHPFAPFVTETIWQTLGWEKSLLMTSKWPKSASYDKKQAAAFEQLQALVSEIRFVSTELASGKQTLLVKNDALVKENQKIITHLAQLKGIEHVSKGRGLRLAIAAHEAWLDVDAKTLEQHQTKLQDRLAAAHENIARLQNRLGNKSYVKNAPEAVVAQSKEQLAEQQTIAERLQRELEINNN
jgi:valyl-tRNA synthetase